MAEIRNPLSSAVDDSYSDEERDFLTAIDRYKRVNQRPLPTWREVLAVVHSLGYRRTEAAGELPTFARGGAQAAGVKVTRHRGARP